MTSVSAVIVTWNSQNVLPACLTTLDGADEVVVVDNGSKDSTRQVAAKFPGVRVIANPDNRGLAAANNQGLVATTGEAVLICNPDVIFRPGAVAELVAVMDRHPRAAWVEPHLLYEDGATQTSAGDLPSLGEALLGRQLGRRRRPGEPFGFWWDGWPHNEERAIGRGHEAAYLVRRRAVHDVGLQDEDFRLDWEGIDWTERFRRAGWEVWLAPEAEVVHLGGGSIRRVPTRWVVSQHQGMYRYYAKRRSPAWKPFLAAAFTLRAATKLALTRAGVPMYQWSHRDPRQAPPVTPSP